MYNITATATISIQLKLGKFLDGYQRTRLCSIFVCMSLQSGSKT